MINREPLTAASGWGASLMMRVGAVSEAGSRRWRLAKSSGTADHRHSEADHPGNPGFTGLFNIETFIVAPGVGQAPNVHHKRFPDASSNPATAPVHPFHLGLWFNDPADAVRAGCPNQ